MRSPTTTAMADGILRIAWRSLGRCEHYAHHNADECEDCGRKGSSYGFAGDADGSEGFTGWRGPFCSIACYRAWLVTQGFEVTL